MSLEPRFAREVLNSGDYETAALLESPLLLNNALSYFKSVDPRILQIKQEVSFIARFTLERELNVFITGETGTGKELIAAALGSVSTSSKVPGKFVAINCAAMPQDLIESELFGHRKGAFTGADTDKAGLIQSAQNGALFLDEIGDMPIFAQAKLLRVMSTRKVRRVGSNIDEPEEVNCRFIGATHRDVFAQIAQGLFREDLYWRLAQWTIEIPPLRERRSDILEIIHSISDWQMLTEENLTSLQDPALTYAGNVRELYSRAVQMIIRNKMLRYQVARAAIQRPARARA